MSASQMHTGGRANADVALAKARTQWLLGDWSSLAALAADADLATERSHQAELAALSAAACLALGDAEEARQRLDKAVAHGFDEARLRRLAIAAIHHTLGRARLAAAGEAQEPSTPNLSMERAVDHFRAALAIGGVAPANERWAVARLIAQVLPQGASAILEARLNAPFLAVDDDLSPALDFSRLHSRLTGEFLRALKSDSAATSDGALGTLAACIQGVVGDDRELRLATTRIEAAAHALLVHVDGDHIPSMIAQTGDFYEAGLLKILADFHREGGVVIDCGANIGNHCLYFAGTLGARVVAIEPEPHNYACLLTNLKLNELDKRVSACPVALGSGAGRVVLSMSVRNNFGSFTARQGANPNATAVAEAMAVDVVMTSLDRLVTDSQLSEPVSIIKLDVEGMEAEVLLGALEVIRGSLPAIAVECFSAAELERIEAILGRFGYFAVDVANATPTFVFVSERNPIHARRYSSYLRNSLIERARVRKGFV